MLATAPTSAKSRIRRRATIEPNCTSSTRVDPSRPRASRFTFHSSHAIGPVASDHSCCPVCGLFTVIRPLSILHQLVVALLAAVVCCSSSWMSLLRAWKGSSFGWTLERPSSTIWCQNAVRVGPLTVLTIRAILVVCASIVNPQYPAVLLGPMTMK